MPRKNYIYNPKPVFNPPKNKRKISTFICYAMKKASKIDVARSNLNYTLLPIDPKTGNILPRFRRLNEHRACAMRAIVLAMLYYFDIHSNLVEASIEKLADECGLSTFSDSGNKSITRVSRLINDFLEPMGFVRCKKIKRKFVSNYIPKKIFLTPMFFMLFNISQSKINSYLFKSKKMSQNLKITEKKIFISFSDIKVMSQLDEKSIRKKILNALINYYTANELTKIGPKGLKKRIDIEYNNLCKLFKKIKK
uniref:Putative replication-associated protein n=1 Tax=Buchnera aphidicola subsp. Diuraphis noxia TaxID=118101 RepID=D3U0T2_BUCDN|nr:plasmid replication initiator RepA [Buchnera aphidicola]ACX50529.1 putative replication-associated protein [Buchnera aphidicola (Diuraphis noxia)]ACX50536.1 putative replication-associated protein [Buchnera aphidicola (Diuraphis noxia)]ACX50543.1 putative replication-associated protein [Buchnera aphidicola (Diuraphis noxia)]ACX50550.1 putative replication-associated protein [Buchnera aphidicola (Diuraphis noxia)]ACX50557.1 putative replication-associated protein [Buchnera aphidicola (Diurap